MELTRPTHAKFVHKRAAFRVNWNGIYLYLSPLLSKTSPFEIGAPKERCELSSALFAKTMCSLSHDKRWGDRESESSVAPVSLIGRAVKSTIVLWRATVFLDKSFWQRELELSLWKAALFTSPLLLANMYTTRHKSLIFIDFYSMVILITSYIYTITTNYLNSRSSGMVKSQLF